MADTLSLLEANQRLLDAIATSNWQSYEDLCDTNLTAIEPESEGLVVKGLGFHRFYFDLASLKGKRQTTICQPSVHLIGEVGVLGYIRLVQFQDENGSVRTIANAETRVWQWKNGVWKHIHFHRTPLDSK